MKDRQEARTDVDFDHGLAVDRHLEPLLLLHCLVVVFADAAQAPTLVPGVVRQITSIEDAAVCGKRPSKGQQLPPVPFPRADARPG
jgi:hypothetical protein